jgi:hypothetical protein
MIPEILPPTEDKFIDADIGGAVAACSGFFARRAERAVLIASPVSNHADDEARVIRNRARGLWRNRAGA